MQTAVPYTRKRGSEVVCRAADVKLREVAQAQARAQALHHPVTKGEKEEKAEEQKEEEKEEEGEKEEKAEEQKEEEKEEDKDAKIQRLMAEIVKLKAEVGWMEESQMSTEAYAQDEEEANRLLKEENARLRARIAELEAVSE